MPEKIQTQIYKEHEEGQVFEKLLEKQCGFYRVVLELTRVENEKFCTERPLGEIIAVMKKKKILLSCIEEIEEQIRPLRKSWDEKREEFSSHAVGIQQSLADLEALISEILTIDQKNQQMLAAYMKDLQEQKEKLSKASSADKAVPSK